MGFTKDLFGKEPALVTLDDIDSLINTRKEEDRFLEYKDPRILEAPEKLSGWVSAFLNADGGLIILGVCEDDPRKKDKISAKIVPVRREFVTKEYPKERVEQLIFSHIRSSSKPNIVIHPVRDDADPTNAIYMIEIAPGDNPPYQASDDKYYRRLNATKYAMPHSEIADFFGARRKPKLSLRFEMIEVNLQDLSFTLRAFLRNQGKALAKHARVTASFTNLGIVTIAKGQLQRIDDLRDVPSIQWDCSMGRVIYHSGRETRIWDMELKVKNGLEPVRIQYDLVAEDMDSFTEKYTIPPTLLQQVHDLIQQGKRPTLLKQP